MLSKPTMTRMSSCVSRANRLRWDRLIAEANSLEHKLHHGTKIPYSAFCDDAKATRTPARRKKPKLDAEGKPVEDEAAPAAFGDRVRGDHIIAKRASDGTVTRVGLTLMEDYSGYIDCFAAGSRGTSEVQAAFVQFSGLDTGVK